MLETEDSQHGFPTMKLGFTQVSKMWKLVRRG